MPHSHTARQRALTCVAWRRNQSFDFCVMRRNMRHDTSFLTHVDLRYVNGPLVFSRIVTFGGFSHIAIGSERVWWANFLNYLPNFIGIGQAVFTRTWLRYVRVFAVAIPSVCLSVVCLSVTLVHPTQGVELFGKISSPLCTLAILWPPCKILRR